MTYVLFHEPQPIERLGCWQRKLPPFTHVAGYSGVGHFFFITPKPASSPCATRFGRHTKAMASSSRWRLSSLRCSKTLASRCMFFAQAIKRPSPNGLGHSARMRCTYRSHIPSSVAPRRLRAMRRETLGIRRNRRDVPRLRLGTGLTAVSGRRRPLRAFIVHPVNRPFSQLPIAFDHATD